MRVIWFAFVILSTLVVLILLWQFSISIVLFVLSLAIAAAVLPTVSQLTHRGYSRPVALGIVYSLIVAFMILLILLISQPLFQDLQKIGDDFATNYERLKMNWPRQGTLFQRTLADRLPPANDLYATLISEEGIIALTGVFGIAQNVFSLLGNIAIMIILSLYWSADQMRFERLGLSLLPVEYHRKAREVWRSVETGVGAYVRSELIQSVLTGIILGIGYWLMGVRYPAILALWVAIARLIPWFGAMIAVLPPLFVGIGSSPALGLLVSIYTIVVLILMKWIIEPRFFLRNQYNSLLIVLFVIALAETFGIIGVMLAPPLAVAVQILFEQLFPTSRIYSHEIVEKTNYLKKRISRLEKRVDRKDQPLPRETKQQIEQLQALTNNLVDYLEEN